MAILLAIFHQKDFDKLIQDTTKMAEEQAKLRLQLENEVANQVTKIRNDLAKKT